MASRLFIQRHLTKMVSLQPGFRYISNTNGYRHLSLFMTSRYNFSNNNSDSFDEIAEIDPIDLEKQRKGNKYLIIDVREPFELQNDFNLGQDKYDWINIPKDFILDTSDKQQFEQLLNDNGVNNLNEHEDLYFLCRAGVRSLVVAKHLNEFDLDQRLFNITGGTNKYAKDVGFLCFNE